MFTLVGSILGFLGSAFPEIIKIFQERQDKKHELAIMDRQIEMAQQGHTQRLEEIQSQADIAESRALYRHASQSSNVAWVEALRASVRPILTYAFFLLFATVKVAALTIFITHEDADIATALIQIWDSETAALFAAIISFWFGQRALTKLLGRKP